MKSGETREACVIREVKEETNLDVKVERFLFEYSWDKSRSYQVFSTFHCTIVAGIPRPGEEYSQTRSLIGVKWFALHDESHWEPDLFEEHLYPSLMRIRMMIPYERI